MVRNRQRGVTLIELLVAVTLVSLLSVGMVFAIRIGLNTLDKTNATMMANRRVLGAQRAIDQQINGLIPVNAVCGGNPGAPPVRERMLFFQGDMRSMRFVTSYSLEEAGRGYPRILEYAVIPRPDDLGVRLIVNEHPYTGPTPVSREPAWLPGFSGTEPPSAIRVEMTPLQADQSRLQMSTITVPLRVNRSAAVAYKDIDDPDLLPQ
jgi:prepilin-type N-terminal cleavage/methylation domain-containing protein